MALQSSYILKYLRTWLFRVLCEAGSIRSVGPPSRAARHTTVLRGSHEYGKRPSPRCLAGLAAATALTPPAPHGLVLGGSGRLPPHIEATRATSPGVKSGGLLKWPFLSTGFQEEPKKRGYRRGPGGQRPLIGPGAPGIFPDQVFLHLPGQDVAGRQILGAGRLVRVQEIFRAGLRGHRHRFPPV